jgi:hypothetical protein
LAQQIVINRNDLLRWQILLLAWLILFGQVFLTVHEISHADQYSHDADHDQGVCVTCLAISGINVAPPPMHAIPGLLQTGTESLPGIAIIKPRSAPFRYFQSRAPPVSLS